MAQENVAQRWQKRFRDLLKEIDGLFADACKTGEVEAIHNLRVALRRARLLALAGRPGLGRTSADTFRHQAFQIMELLGGLRDADITLEWLQRHDARRQLTGRVRARRHHLWRTTAPQMKMLRLFDRADLAAGKLNGAREKKLRRRFNETLERFYARLVADKGQFHHLDMEGLHEFRRNLRRWRYLNETLLSRREQKASEPLSRVIALQDALGEMQNCDVIRQFLRTLNLPPVEARALDQKLARQQRDWLAKAGTRLGAVAQFGN